MLPVGGPAIGEDFVDRENEIKAITDSFEKDNILLTAPRRYGRTSIMKRIQTILNQGNIPVIFIDIHDIDSPEEFLMKLATEAFDMAKDKKSFIEKLKSFFSGKLKDLEEFEISLGELKIRFKRSLKEEIKKSDWKEEGRIIFTFMTNYFSNTVYFIIDEFSECVHNMSKRDKKDTEAFLKWFRSLRAEEDNLRFIIGGSVSIDRVVKNVTTLSAINDFKRITIDGFSRETALDIVEKFFEREELTYTDRIGEKIVECIGVPSIPYFLSVFLNIIGEESTEVDLDEKNIEEIYIGRFMGARGKHYFDYYVQRLKTYYSSTEEKVAKSILKELCQYGEISTEIAFDIFKKITNIDDYEWFVNLVYDLSNDFYLKKTDSKVVFYSKPLADWWRFYYF